MSAQDAPFVALAPPDDIMARPIIGHVPHASRHIPLTVRSELEIDDAELADELRRLTDSHTDALFDGLRLLGATLFIDRLSRLVFDPERFVDPDLEPTEAIGQGVVYTHGSRRQRIRMLSPELRAERIERLYRPYHAALTALVSRDLEADGECTIIDCHSFASDPLPSELDQTPGRPDICIGTDGFHSPPELISMLEASLRSRGLEVRRDAPFSGTFVPGAFLGSDARVRSVMIEVRRGLYIDESTGERSTDFERVAASIDAALAEAFAPAGR